MLCLNDKDDENCKLEELKLKIAEKEWEVDKTSSDLWPYILLFIIIFPTKWSWVGPKSEEFNEIQIINNIDG